MNLSTFEAHRKPRRKVNGMAAMLLPFRENGSIASESYQALFQETLKAGLTPAVNMDTGYVNLLTDEEKAYVLGLAQEVAQGAPFLAGAYIERREGEIVDLYRREIDRIVEYGGTPILFQTARLQGVSPAQVIETYARSVAGCSKAYAFELGKMFAPNGEIWSEEIAQGIMGIPEIVGMKHSSLDRGVELQRLMLRDRVRPDFAILTGNDLGIDMIEYGSDYLLGLAAFSPAKFAERDRLWEAGDAAYLEVADALQYLGNIAFRPPVPAYKHSAATFLHLAGKIPTDHTHPGSPSRPDWEREMLADCLRRLQ